MGMTMTQKILASAAGLDSVCAGQLIEANLDLVLGNDVTSPVAIGEMKKMNVDGVFDKDKIAIVLDHFTPNKDINVYIMDYSGTNGESLGKVRRFLEDKGYNVVGGIEARTCYVEKSYSICKGGSDLSAKLALDLGTDTYTVNPDLNSEADVVVIIGKDL